MVPGSSGGDFEPAAGRTGGQGPRRFKFQTGALCSDSRSEVRGGSAPRGGTYRFTVVHIPGVKFHGDSVTERRRRCAAMGQPALDLRDWPANRAASQAANQPASQPASHPGRQAAGQPGRHALRMRAQPRPSWASVRKYARLARKGRHALRHQALAPSKTSLRNLGRLSEGQYIYIYIYIYISPNYFAAWVERSKNP